MNFVEALESKNIDAINQFPKSDIHSHAGRGGNARFITERTGKEIPVPPKKYETLTHMQEWFNEYIKPVCGGVEGQILRWEACFAEAKRSNIMRLSLSFSRLDVELVGGMERFMDILEKYHAIYCPDTVFLPELTYGRNCNVGAEAEKIDELLSYNYFKSIDICNGEFQQPIENFRPLYRRAKDAGLVLKAHVGEFGSADDVIRAVKTLELNEVHHGVAVSGSSFAMNWLAKEKIQLNICPSSNVMLGVAKSYAEHPIKRIYRAGVPVTINTDDLLIFNNTIGQEYLNLYCAGALSAEELEDIRLKGLKWIEKKI